MQPRKCRENMPVKVSFIIVAWSFSDGEVGELSLKGKKQLMKIKRSIEWPVHCYNCTWEANPITHNIPIGKNQGKEKKKKEKKKRAKGFHSSISIAPSQSHSSSYTKSRHTLKFWNISGHLVRSKQPKWDRLLGVTDLLPWIIKSWSWGTCSFQGIKWWVLISRNSGAFLFLLLLCFFLVRPSWPSKHKCRWKPQAELTTEIAIPRNIMILAKIHVHTI